MSSLFSSIYNTVSTYGQKLGTSAGILLSMGAAVASEYIPNGPLSDTVKNVALTCLGVSTAFYVGKLVKNHFFPNPQPPAPVPPPPAPLPIAPPDQKLREDELQVIAAPVNQFDIKAGNTACTSIAAKAIHLLLLQEPQSSVFLILTALWNMQKRQV